MITKDFQTAAHKTQPYVFDYTREVAALYRDWPEMQQSLFFIDASSAASKIPIIGITEPAANELWARLNEDDDFDEDLRAAQNEGSVCIAYKDLNCSCVFLNKIADEEKFGRQMTEERKAMEACFTLDHEAAHAVCRDGYTGGFNLSECIADAYASLRHFQRFGTKTGVIEDLLFIRAAEMLGNADGNHFSSPVIKKIIEDSATMDLARLTPKETAQLARSYAVKYAMPPETLQNIADECLKMKKGYVLQLDEIGRAVLSTRSAEVFLWGAMGLRTLLDGEVVMRGLEPLAPEKEKELRQALASREAAPSLKTSGLRDRLLGMIGRAP